METYEVLFEVLPVFSGLLPKVKILLPCRFPFLWFSSCKAILRWLVFCRLLFKAMFSSIPLRRGFRPILFFLIALVAGCPPAPYFLFARVVGYLASPHAFFACRSAVF